MDQEVGENDDISFAGLHLLRVTWQVQSEMTDVPDNRTSQIAEFKQIEEVYKIIVFFNTPKFLNIQ